MSPFKTVVLHLTIISLKATLLFIHFRIHDMMYFTIFTFSITVNRKPIYLYCLLFDFYFKTDTKSYFKNFSLNINNYESTYNY